MVADPSVLKTLRDKASRGALITLEECRLFISSIRKSYVAAEAKVKTPKTGEKLSRNKETPQQDIDFF